jgi:hypothetical protein
MKGTLEIIIINLSSKSRDIRDETKVLAQINPHSFDIDFKVGCL